MNKYLAVKLQGVLQAWGGHTFEDLRHTELIPTRSGILGLFAACLGIRRREIHKLQKLSSSLTFAVRIDSTPTRITDYHTVMSARKVDGKPNPNPVESRREYLCDAVYTILVSCKNSEGISLERLQEAIKKPIFTPFLGRRSCPLSRPLFEDLIIATDVKQAFGLVEPVGGTIYSEIRLHEHDSIWRLRDEPVYERKRQFASRNVFIHPASVKED